MVLFLFGSFTGNSRKRKEGNLPPSGEALCVNQLRKAGKVGVLARKNIRKATIPPPARQMPIECLRAGFYLPLHVTQCGDTNE